MMIAQKETFSKDWFISDDKFHGLYPESVQLLAGRHWTPLNVARSAATFLSTEKQVKILDIGSGVGKFCLGAAFYNPNSTYYGVEQRKSLIYTAEYARQILRLNNVSFIHANFTQLSLIDYDHFYFYNAFYENLSYTDKIDHDIAYSGELYNYYNRYLYNQLDQKKAGTRLATFHSLEDEIPRGYHEVGSEFDDLLKFWIKK